MLYRLRFPIEEFRKYLRNRSIICIGAGIQGVRAAYYLYDWGFGDHILSYADNSSEKQGRSVSCEERKYPILSMEDAVLQSDERTVFVITSLYVEELTKQLEGFAKERDISCVALDEVAEEELLSSDYPNVVREHEEPVIPKIIHYSWVGGPMPDSIRSNVLRWMDLCPEYEFRKWDESNYDFHRSAYAGQAYDHKKWGFVPDVMRLDIIYRYGGIYLDTDIEMIKKPDELLYQNCFASVDASLTMNLGSGFGARPGCGIIKELRDYYEDVSFVDQNGKPDLTSCNTHSYKTLRKHGYKINNRLQRIKEMNIYPMIFQGMCQHTGMKRVTPHTYWIHHGNMSWFGK